jgi:hypothetical protein
MSVELTPPFRTEGHVAGCTPRRACPDRIARRRLRVAAWLSSGLILVSIVGAAVWLAEAEGGDSLNSSTRRPARAEASPDLPSFLLLLMTANASMLAWTIHLDSRAAIHWLEDADFRVSVAVPPLFAAAGVTAWAVAAAERLGIREAGGLTLFVCLPTLAVSAPLLWRSVLALRQPRLGALLLAAFVLATAGVERLCAVARGGEVAERAFTCNSMLIGLAIAIRLGVWGVTSFRSPRPQAA